MHVAGQIVHGFSIKGADIPRIRNLAPCIFITVFDYARIKSGRANNLGIM